MLVCISRASGLRAYICGVKYILLYLRHISREMIGFTPVRILDHNFCLGIYLLSGAHYQILRDVLHEFASEGNPVSVALFPDTALTAAVGEIKVIKNDLIKELCRIFRYLLHLIAHGRIGIAERVKHSSLACFSAFKIINGGGYTA